MKSFCNDDNSTSLLGFSLSSNTKMGGGRVVVPHHRDSKSHNNQAQPDFSGSASAPASASASIVSVVPHLGDSNYGICYGTGEIYSHLPMMPLRSDGSLCIMEALTGSQSNQASNPKMEDFFGGALTMGTQHHNNKEAMALSLDSIFYNTQEPNNQDSLKIFQENPSQENHHQMQAQSYQYNNYSEIKGHELTFIREGSKDTHVASDSNLLLSAEMKNWVSSNYTNDPEITQSGCSRAVSYGEFQQSLSLSMSPGSQSSCVTGSQQHLSSAVLESVAMESKKRGQEVVEQKHVTHRKSIDTFGQRTSQYRGVTRHRWTGRYEAHLWDNSYKKEGQSRKGRQVYLGGYDMEEKAARSYDLAALKYWGPSTHTNFPVENYQNEIEEMKNMTRQEYVAHLRRKSSGFSRGASMYRGVTRHHQHGRWQARIGRVAGNKDLYLGTFSTQEEAAEAYDIAAIKFRGTNAVTNFDITRYDVERIMASNTLLSGELARKGNKETRLEKSEVIVNDQNPNRCNNENASSLANSLNGSISGSPERILSFPAIFAYPQGDHSKMFNTSVVSNVSSWTNPSTELMKPHVGLALPQLPVFAAWTDS